MKDRLDERWNAPVGYFHCMGKKNVGHRKKVLGGPSNGPRTRFKFCPIHQIRYLKKYPHICDGIPVGEKEALKGWKKKRSG